MSASTFLDELSEEPSVAPAPSVHASRPPQAVALDSLVPLVALGLLVGTLLWGPFVTLGLTAIAGRLLCRYA